jgi:DNA ligase 4
MHISVKEATIFSVFHPDAQDLYNTCSDLKKVAWVLWDPTHRLNAEDKTVQIFRPFAPMLCKRPTRRLEDSIKEMEGSTFFIEEKLDGERMQLHKRGNEYFYSSRFLESHCLGVFLSYKRNTQKGKRLHLFVRQTRRSWESDSFYCRVF